ITPQSSSVVLSSGTMPSLIIRSYCAMVSGTMDARATAWATGEFGVRDRFLGRTPLVILRDYTKPSSLASRSMYGDAFIFRQRAVLCFGAGHRGHDPEDVDRRDDDGGHTERGRFEPADQCRPQRAERQRAHG